MIAGDEAGQTHRDVTFAIGVTLLAASLGVVGVLFHEVWRDEAYTWLVARSTTSLSELMWNMGFNGHPKPYYIFNYVLVSVLPWIWTIQVTNLACALGATFLFADAAPLGRPERLLFSLGFFPLYQYGVIARSYALMWLLLFVYLWLRQRQPQRLLFRFFLLALLAQVHLYSMLLAAVLGGFELLVAGGQRTRGCLVGAGLVMASIAISAAQMIPAAGSSSPVHATPILQWPQFVANGFAPAFEGFPATTHQRILGLTLFAASLLILRRSRLGLLLYAILIVGLLATLARVYPGYRWHHGCFFIFFLAALWWGSVRPRGVWRGTLIVMLGVHAMLGIRALALDVMRPYSNGREIARVMLSNDLHLLPLVGLAASVRDDECMFTWEIDSIQPVLAYLPSGKGILNVRTGEFDSFWRHYTDSQYLPVVDARDMVSTFEQLHASFRAPLAIVVSEWAAPSKACGLPTTFQRIARSSDALDFGERYAVYRFPADGSAIRVR